MFKPLPLLAAAGVAIGVPAVLDTYIQLQPDTPGAVQTGHMNITGTVKAGSIAGYSNVTTGIAYGGDFRSVSDQGRGILGNASSKTGVTYGGLFQSFSSSGRGVAGIAAATTGATVGGFFVTNSTSGKGIQGASKAATGLNYGGYFSSLSSQGIGVYGMGAQATGAMPVNVTGVWGDSAQGIGVQANSLQGIGLSAYADSGIGIRAQSNGGYGLAALTGGTATSAVYGVATAGTGTSTAIYGQCNSPTGFAGKFVGGQGVAINQDNPVSTGLLVTLTDPNSGCIGMHIVNNSLGNGVIVDMNNSSGGAYGIQVNGNHGRGVSVNIPNGDGVKATTNLLSTGALIGHNQAGEGVIGFSMAPSAGAVVGRTDADNGYGVRGFATEQDAVGVLGQVGISGGYDGYGVRGDAVNVNGNGIGVYGAASGATQYAMYANGRSVTTGTKSFMIDHPDDPTHKALVHYCTEGNEPLNTYSGNVRTDDNGAAWVTLPTYVEEINKDFRYQLTVIGSFAQAIIGEELQGNRFQIKTDKPGVKVSWRVEGVRNDKFVKKYGAPDVIEKTGSWKGKYLQPELWGAKPSDGIFYINPVNGASANPGVTLASKRAHK